MKRSILILIITLLISMVGAQNPGFMGRHIFINGNVMLSPAWKNPNAMSKYLTKSASEYSSFSDYTNNLKNKWLGLNYFVLPDIEVIVWRKGSVGAGYNFFDSPFKGYYSAEGINNSTSFVGQITAHGFHVFYKQYLGQTYAPFGQYIKFNFDGFFYRYGNFYTGNDTGIHSEENLIPDGKNRLFGLKVEYGYDFLFFNVLKFNIGVSLGSTFGGYKAISFGDNTKSGLAVKDYANNRLLGAYWFGLHCGIGFLTF